MLVQAITVTASALQWTVNYTQQREAFGQKISDFQHARFKLAELHAEILAKRVFVYRCIKLHLQQSRQVIGGAVRTSYWDMQ